MVDMHVRVGVDDADPGDATGRAQGPGVGALAPGARRTRLTGRGAAVLGLGLVTTPAGALLAYPSVLALGVALLALLGAAVVGARTSVPVAVRRRDVPHQVARLADRTTTLVLTSRSARTTVRVTAVDHVDGVPQPARPVVLLPGETAVTRTALPTRRRGQVELGPLVLTRHGLAGLLTSEVARGDRRTVTVVPRLVDASGPAGGRRRSPVGADEAVERGGTDLVGLREYVPGDDLRRLHWASSARTGTLVVREDADPAEPHLTVLLDDRAASHATDDDLDEAVDVAASLVVAAGTSGVPGRLRTWSGGLVHDVLPARHGLGVRPEDVAAVLHAAAGVGSADATAHAPTAGTAVDVLAVVTGRSTPLDALVALAGSTGQGTVLVVDPAPDRVLAVHGDVTVLRGPRAEDLCRAWTVAGAS